MKNAAMPARYGSYDPRRYRILAWTGFFKQTSLLFWGYGGGGLPYQTSFFPGGLSNESIGWEEQLETKILTDFVSRTGSGCGTGQRDPFPGQSDAGLCLVECHDFGALHHTWPAEFKCNHHQRDR